LTAELLFDGIKAAPIHSNKSQSIRTRTLAEFKRGELRVLVATDVAARGLDIERLPHVVNYDLPQVPQDYVHRIGRTGRAGENGVALSLVSSAEKPLLYAIEELLEYEIPRQAIAEFPQVAIKRGAKTKVTKKSKGLSKPTKKSTKSTKAKPSAKPSKTKASTNTKKPTKAKAPEKTTNSRRDRSATERSAPKVGRRGSRS